MKLEDVDEARASWMKLEMICIQLCQGAVSVGCTDKPCIVDSVPDHMVVVAFQKLAAFIPVVVQEPEKDSRHRLLRLVGAHADLGFLWGKLDHFRDSRRQFQRHDICNEQVC